MIPRKVLNELHAGVKEAEAARDEAEACYAEGKVDTGNVCRREAEIGFLNCIARALVTLVASLPIEGDPPRRPGQRNPLNP